MSKPLALVTGGNTGIGLELSRLFAADGYDLILVARDEKRLAEAKAELESKYANKVDTLALDLSDSDAPAELAAALGSRMGELQALVNNAGFGLSGAFSETKLETELAMISVNISALVHLTKLAVPGMIARKKGYILNVGSTAGFQPGPFMAIYYASKAFVNSFTTALNAELDGTGVNVSCLCPGPVETNFGARAGNDASKLFKQRVAIVSPPDVAKAGYDALMSNKPFVVPGAFNKLAIGSLRIIPRSIITSMVKNLNRA